VIDIILGIDRLQQGVRHLARFRLERSPMGFTPTGKRRLTTAHAQAEIRVAQFFPEAS
jgi:hypothetical protein